MYLIEPKRAEAGLNLRSMSTYPSNQMSRRTLMIEFVRTSMFRIQ